MSKKWYTWIGCYREDWTSSLFDIGQPDMAIEIRNGLRWKMDDKNTFTIVNRYDIGKGQQYSTKYSWEHKFCCWMLAFEYEQEQLENDSTRRIVYYFYNL